MASNGNVADIDMEEVFKFCPTPIAVPRRLPRINNLSPSKKIIDRKSVAHPSFEIGKVIQNTVSNSEHPDPMRFQLAEIKKLKEEKTKKKEMVDSILEKAKTLPPPIDNFRVLLPKPIKYSSNLDSKQKFLAEQYSLVPSVIETKPQSYEFQGSFDRPANRQNCEQLRSSLEKPALLNLKNITKYNGLLDYSLLTHHDNISKIFDQIIYDAKSLNNYRIRPHERKEISNILNAYSVSPEMLNSSDKISENVKYNIVQAARKWPWYFSRVFEVVEIREREAVTLLMSIAEHGIRFLIHVPFKTEDPLQVHDHISWNELVEAVLNDDGTFVLRTSSGGNIMLRSSYNHEIHQMISSLWIPN